MAINEQTVRGDWNQFKGEVKEKWGEVTDDDLDRAAGNFDQLIGLLQQKTGETRAAIEQSLEQMASNSSEIFANASEAIRSAANTATQNAQAISEDAMKQVEAGYIQTKRTVANRPVESLAVCFGVGMITGIVAAMMTRSR